MRKEKVLNGVTARLTDTEFAEYQRLGGITWLRLFLRHSAELKASLDIQSLEKEQRKKARQNLRYYERTVSEAPAKVVASKWQPVKALIEAKR
jgi:hypothetical protein